MPETIKLELTETEAKSLSELIAECIKKGRRLCACCKAESPFA